MDWWSLVWSFLLSGRRVNIKYHSLLEAVTSIRSVVNFRYSRSWRGMLAWVIHVHPMWFFDVVCNYSWTWTSMWCPGSSFKPQMQLDGGNLCLESWEEDLPSLPALAGFCLVAPLKVDLLLRTTQTNTGKVGCALPECLRIWRKVLIWSAPYGTVGGKGRGKDYSK